MEPERILTPRKCKPCFEYRHQTNYLWRQYWGKNIKNEPEYKFDCLVCGDHTYGPWGGNLKGYEEREEI